MEQPYSAFSSTEVVGGVGDGSGGPGNETGGAGGSGTGASGEGTNPAEMCGTDTN